MKHHVARWYLELKEKREITSCSKSDDHQGQIEKAANKVGKSKLQSPLAILLPTICGHTLLRTPSSAVFCCLRAKMNC